MDLGTINVHWHDDTWSKEIGEDPKLVQTVTGDEENFAFQSRQRIRTEQAERHWDHGIKVDI